jgi:Serine carboxypeptidase
MIPTRHAKVTLVGFPKHGWLALSVSLGLLCGCGSEHRPTTPDPDPRPIANEAGFVELAPRQVSIHDRPVPIEATSQIFYNFRPADSGAENKPLIVLFNGFASDVVRAFGTGPTTVEPDGSVMQNPDSLTRFANLLYLEPRQSGFSYDVIDGRAPAAADCSQDVFSEYVDAADVLLATLRFLKAHPTLQGPVYWMGESYAGVRITWIVAYLRGAWSLVPYRDDAVRAELAPLARNRLLAGQILLQPWLAGSAHGIAIQAACKDSNLLAAVQAAVTGPCSTADACQCANDFGRSPYNYTLSKTEQDARIFAADAAQVSPDVAEALYGARFENIPGLSGSERSRGFKCSTADSETPDQSALATLLGALPNGQSYNLAYSPLTTGKGSTDPDWRRQTLVGTAFLENAQTVDALITDGVRDLVVPEIALAGALRAVSGTTSVSETASELLLGSASGTRSVAIRHYANSGHMITMTEPKAFADDLITWLAPARD